MHALTFSDKPLDEAGEKQAASEHRYTDTSRNKAEKVVIASCLSLSGIIFIGDLMIPLGVAGGVPYVAVVLLAMWAPSRRLIYLTAGLCSLLTAAGYFLSPAGGVMWVVLANRALALFAIWATAILGSRLMLALNEAKRAKEKARNYLEVAGTILMTVGADQKIRMINKMGSAVLGLDEDEIVGKNWFENFIPERTRKDEMCGFKEMITGGRKPVSAGNPPITSPVITADGGERLIAWHFTPLRGDDGGIAEVLCSGEDVTERKMVENDLRRTKKRAEESAKLRDRFLSLVSHDLRNPLSLLLIFLRSMRQNDKLELEKKDRKLLETSIHSAETMAEMISELLEMTRLKNGIMKPEKKFLNVRHLVLNQIHLLAHLAKKKGIRLVNNIPKNSRIYADPTLSDAVVQNLAANSIKFSERGDTVAVFMPDDRPSTIAVFDTGMGIEPERFNNIFNYEIQTSTKGSSGERGTGLGLPICREIMEAHGGELLVMSSPREGCTFMAVFPDVKPRVLLVGGDGSVSSEIENLLVNDGATVESVDNGKNAMEVISESPPNLILVDSAASRINGIDLLNELKNDENLRRIPVIVTAESDNEEQARQEMRYEAVEYLEKALVSKELMPLVKRHIG
ncbi:MAG: ATP-binding protein [Nitrospinota bacterium]